MASEGLRVGDMAPDFRVMAAVNGDIVETGLETLLQGKRGLVLTSYVMDFTGG